MNENKVHGCVKWQSPSNIAIVKYWGKSPNGVQIPQNPSISFTLSKCRTETSIAYEASDRFGLHFRFDGKENPEWNSISIRTTRFRIRQALPRRLRR